MLPDVMRGGYFLPMAAVLLFWLTLALAVWQRSQWRGHRWLAFGLVAAIAVGNIISLPEHLQIMENGHMAGNIAEQPVVRMALQDPDFDYRPYLLHPRTRELIKTVRSWRLSSKTGK